VKLLCRMYDPERGVIRWDGADIRDFDPARLRERISGVFQDFVCYELTAAENIGVGDLASLGDREALRKAAELAGAAADVEALPQGYDTMLSRVYSSAGRGSGPQVGVCLSGGQRQRVALARALMRTGRDLLIVDEPMASLDAEAESAMNRRLGEMRSGQTCVLISHRMAAVRECGRIIVLADGAVAEEGTHAELMATGGRYARLFRMQAAGYRDMTNADGTSPGVRAAR
jgi:ATP-binding cassette subfamily B protein